MSKELFTKRPQATIETNDGDQIDRLLAKFPEENHPRILQRLEGLSEQEQIELLKNMAERRREATAKPRYVSERLRTITTVPASVFEKFEEGKNQVEVGRGDNGRVFEFHPPEETDGGTSVFKILLRPPMPVQNDLLSEGAYQADVAAFADGNTDTRIGVPHPYYIAASDKGHVLAMEKMPGRSVDDILEENILLPADYDYATVERALEEFVRRMNEAGFYHRDLREGNILIDPAPVNEHAPIAYVIDFGFCIKAGSREEAYRDLDGLKDHVMIKKVMDRLRQKQELLRTQGV